jgi:thiol-disulfide isomerase/thioredoxin
MQAGGGSQDDWWVLCLCAGWCGVCRDWQPAFDEAARSLPQARFAWVDVEDQSDAMGEVEIETFPTLLIAQGDQARFLGPVPPSAAGVTRLVAALQSQADVSPMLAPSAQGLWRRLAAHVLPDTDL